jgi:pyridoxal phosphate enzyme (YggS family)
MGDALERAGRADAVTIVAVTKGHPLEAVDAALTMGLHRLGESRVQELELKVEEVGREGPEWHLIGHLQRNKARRGIELFDLIHSVDSLRLARTLSAEADRAGVEVRGLAQVNVSGEASKGGLAGAEAVDALGEMLTLPRLRIEGLMTMAPLTDDEAVLRRTFADTRRLLETAATQLDGLQGRELSMGMSNDFEIAIEEGATMVRLGTVLFGERPR